MERGAQKLSTNVKDTCDLHHTYSRGHESLINAAILNITGARPRTVSAHRHRGLVIRGPRPDRLDPNYHCRFSKETDREYMTSLLRHTKA